MADDPSTTADLARADQRNAALRDQIIEACEDAAIIASYYRTLRDLGVPSALAGRLTLAFADPLEDDE